MTERTFAAIVVAGGAGLRAGAGLGGEAKQWRMLGGKPVVRWSVETLLASGANPLVVVIPAGEEPRAMAALAGLKVAFATGGATRMASVQAGLAIPGVAGSQRVLIHDAARPFLGSHHITALLEALGDAEGALPALPVADTLKRVEGKCADSTLVLDTLDRAGLFRAQTPQAFRTPDLLAAVTAWPAGEIPTDDARIVERAGGRVVLTPGDNRLMKLTLPEDFEMAEHWASARRITCTGQGFDAHRFGPHAEGGASVVWLCGVAIPHDARLLGHSDADAGLHALTDAILGAIGAGDIGDHFPPSDPMWKGAASHLFLEHAAGLVAARGGHIVNVDVTLICEQPKIKPHREAMRIRLAALLNLPLNRVSVKATTTEGMGFTGRGEGLAAQALASVDMPG